MIQIFYSKTIVYIMAFVYNKFYKLLTIALSYLVLSAKFRNFLGKINWCFVLKKIIS